MTTNLWSGLPHVGTHGYVDEPLAVNWTTKGSLTLVINQGQSSTTVSCAAFIGNLPLDCDTDDSTGGLTEKNAMSQQRALARLRDAQRLIHRHQQQVTRRRHGGWTTVFSSRRTPCARSSVAVTKAHGDVSEEPGVGWLVLVFSTRVPWRVCSRPCFRREERHVLAGGSARDTRMCPPIPL